jgi:uncharacterized membrane protein
MLTGLARVAVLGGLAAVAADRLLAGRRGVAAPQPLSMLVVIDAPIEQVWDVVADIPGQPRWMTEMTSVRILDEGPVRPGTRAEATVRILGIEVTDPVTITEVEPPRRYAIRHEGTFKGTGVITLEPGAGGSTTIVRWEETLVPPFLPDLGAVVGAPVLRSVFQADLERLKRLVETGSAA